MAVAVKSVESERPHVSRGVALSPLPRVSPGEIWGHIYWDTPLSNVVNTAAAKIADAGDGIQRIQKNVDRHIEGAVNKVASVAEGARRIYRNGFRGNLEDIRLSYITRNLSSEDADMLRAFSGRPLRRRPQERSGEENSYTAAYALDVGTVRRVDHGDFEPPVTQVLWGRPPLAPTQPLPLPRSHYAHDYQEYPPPPPGQRSYYETDYYSSQRTPFEVQFLNWSPARRVEYMREQIRQQEEERLRQQAILEQAAEILLAKLDERSRLEEQQFELAQAQWKLLPTRVRAHHPLTVL